MAKKAKNPNELTAKGVASSSQNWNKYLLY